MKFQGLMYFIGPRASGKTSVAKALSLDLNFPFEDLDVSFTQKFGLSINDYVAKNSWDSFRREESQILKEVSFKYLPNLAFIATGGGLVLAPENRIFLAEHGYVIYLKSSVDVLVKRLSKNPLVEQRPALTTMSLEAEVAQIFKDREPFYLSLANQVINSDKPLEQVVQEIKQKFF
ncbi:MAG: shikimate kinase AroL [Desulfovibrionaceae bacterium]|nr:shikimate kinase AroL [Desulfovibrionaceae bacterium]